MIFGGKFDKEQTYSDFFEKSFYLNRIFFPFRKNLIFEYENCEFCKQYLVQRK